MRRIVLFLAINLAIALVLSVSMRLLGVEPYLNAQVRRRGRRFETAVHDASAAGRAHRCLAGER